MNGDAWPATLGVLSIVNSLVALACLMLDEVAISITLLGASALILLGAGIYKWKSEP